jgi:hypothetical protein
LRVNDTASTTNLNICNKLTIDTCVAQGEDINLEYMSSIYDSIEAHPIAMHDGEVGDSATADRHKTLHGMLNNARTADTLLRGLAVHDFKFASIEDFTTSLEYTGQDALSD